LAEPPDYIVRIGADGQDQEVIYACVLDDAYLFQAFIGRSGHGEAVGKKVG